MQSGSDVRLHSGLSSRRYKLHLSKLVKQELDLDSTPTMEGGDATPEETSEPVVEEPKPAPAKVTPVIEPKEPREPREPKGSLVVDLSAKTSAPLESKATFTHSLTSQKKVRAFSQREA